MFSTKKLDRLRDKIGVSSRRSIGSNFWARFHLHSPGSQDRIQSFLAAVNLLGSIAAVRRRHEAYRCPSRCIIAAANLQAPPSALQTERLAVVLSTCFPVSPFAVGLARDDISRQASNKVDLSYC